MHEFPLKVILVEFSPREKAIYIRALWRDGKEQRLAPIHEDNKQAYVKAYEGFDNVALCMAFAGLVPEEGGT